MISYIKKQALNLALVIYNYTMHSLGKSNIVYFFTTYNLVNQQRVENVVTYLE